MFITQKTLDKLHLDNKLHLDSIFWPIRNIPTMQTVNKDVNSYSHWKFISIPFRYRICSQNFPNHALWATISLHIRYSTGALRHKMLGQSFLSVPFSKCQYQSRNYSKLYSIMLSILTVITRLLRYCILWIGITRTATTSILYWKPMPPSLPVF